MEQEDRLELALVFRLQQGFHRTRGKLRKGLIGRCEHREWTGSLERIDKFSSSKGRREGLESAGSNSCLDNVSSLQASRAEQHQCRRKKSSRNSSVHRELSKEQKVKPSNYRAIPPLRQ